MELAERLRKLREQTGLSQAKFATRFSIPKSTYEHWEEGMRTPPKYVVEMISVILEYENEFRTIQ